MYKFGKFPPRNLRSFGVASLLTSDCRVFYDSLFGSRNLGRTTDLLMARMREEGLDEFKFRSTLLFNYFESIPLINPDKPLLEPIVVECGFDSEKIALGISFLYADGPSLQGLLNSDEFKIRLMTYAEQSLVRWDPRELRIEVVAMFSIPGKLEPIEPADPEFIDFSVSLDVGKTDEAPPAEETPQAAEYVQMGDLDYFELLRDEKPGKKKPVFATGEIFASQSAQEAETFRIHGTTEQIGGSEVRVVKGSGATADSSVQKVEEPKSKFKELIKVVLGLGGQKIGVEETGTTPAALLTQAAPAAVLKNAPQAPTPAPAENENEEVPQGEVGDMRFASQALVNQIGGGALSVGLENFAETSKEFCKDLPAGSPMRKWLETVAGDLLKEKNELLASAKKVAASVRQREIELRQHKLSNSDDLRRKDEVLYQKGAALKRVKEQLTQANAQIERLKQSAREPNEESAYRQKFTMTQRLLTLEREQAAKMKSEIDQLRDSVNSLRLSQKDSPLLIENGSLKAKMERLKIQHSQMKTMNEQLLKRLKQNGAPEAKPASDDVRRRLESAMRLVAVQQKELELLKAKHGTATPSTPTEPGDSGGEQDGGKAA